MSSQRISANQGRPWAGRELHFIAIGGAGMSGLAQVSQQLGARVTGSDRAESSYLRRVREAGIEARMGHDAEAVPAHAEVVVSTAIRDDNPELAIARERGQRVIHRGELLAELCERRRVIAVGGTHGKTTTAAMVIHALRQIGAQPSFFLGGELPGAGGGGAPANADWTEGEWCVAEADESDASFLRLRPEVAVITNLELDHHSRWSSLSQLEGAFAEFVGPAQAIALGPGVQVGAGAGEGIPLIRFGLPPAPGSAQRRPDLIAEDLELVETGETRFAVHGPGLDLAVRLNVPGRHNVVDALGAIAAVQLAGLDAGAAAEALSSFPGVARRLELKGERAGARVYDDYAHHPTEVAAALEAARALTPRRLVAAFQPHLYSRTKALATEFGQALAAADEIAVLDVYPAREEPRGELAGVSGRMVAEAAAERSGGRPVWWVPDRETAARALVPLLGKGDVLVTLGAGDIFELAENLAEDRS